MFRMKLWDFPLNALWYIDFENHIIRIDGHLVKSAFFFNSDHVRVNTVNGGQMRYFPNAKEHQNIEINFIR